MSNVGPGQMMLFKIVLEGGPEFASEINADTAAVTRLDVATKGLGSSMKAAGDESEAAAAKTKKASAEQSFLAQQTAFTLRRFAFYGTLAAVGAGAAVLKMGLDFDKTMQNASVAFKGFIKGGPQAIQEEMRQLYVMTAKSPFQFPDIVLATRRLLPFVGSVKLTNQVVQNLIDSLSAVGIVSGTSLTRATLGLAHMFSQGKVTGQILTQLSRDNIPLLQALALHFNTTTAAIRTMVTAGLIPATVGAAALNQEMQKPGFYQAGYRLATSTLSGAWSTFKDLIRMGAGHAEMPLFSGLTSVFTSIDTAMLAMFAHNKNFTVSLTTLAKAMDTALTPKTHALLVVFELLSGFLEGLIGMFRGLIGIVSEILKPFATLASHLGITTTGAKLLGFALGVLVFWWLANEAATIVATIALDAYGIAAGLLGPILKGIGAAMGIYTAATDSATGATILFDLATGQWIAVALVAIATIGMLYVQWKWFHNLINDIFDWVSKNWPLLMGVLLGPWTAVIYYIVTNFGLIKKVIEDIINWIVSKMNWFANQMDRLWSHIPFHQFIGSLFGGGPSASTVKAASIGNKAAMTSLSRAGFHREILPGIPSSLFGISFQAGGTVPGPTGSPQIILAHGGETVNPVGSFGDFGNDRPVHVQIMLDRKVLADAVARANQDYAARR